MSSIWFRAYSLADIHQFNLDNMVTHIGIEFTELGPDYLRGTMPVDNRTRQTMGVLHGGASVVLAETLGSIAANLAVDPLQFACVGLDINANHIRSVKSGLVTGTAKPLHLGSTTHVWGIEIMDERGRIVCISRLTMAVLKLEKNSVGKNPFARSGDK
jgi:1,4-dihydroxy-2-naphthoyl-CoA hydrolase